MSHNGPKWGKREQTYRIALRRHGEAALTPIVLLILRKVPRDTPSLKERGLILRHRRETATNLGPVLIFTRGEGGDAAITGMERPNGIMAHMVAHGGEIHDGGPNGVRTRRTGRKRSITGQTVL